MIDRKFSVDSKSVQAPVLWLGTLMEDSYRNINYRGNLYRADVTMAPDNTLD